MLRINTHGDIEYNHKSVTLDELPALPAIERSTAATVLEWQRQHSSPIFRLDYFVGQLSWHVEFLTPDISVPYGIAAKLKANVEMLSSPDERHHVLVVMPTQPGSLAFDRDRFYYAARPLLIEHVLAVS